MDRLQREEKVRQAVANERLEGLSISEEAQKNLDDYVAGRVSAEEAAQQVFARYGVK